MNQRYPEIAIIQLAKSLDDDDESACDWLDANNFKELTAFHHAYLHNSDSAYQWLVDQKQQLLIAFLFALRNSQDAFDVLFKIKAKDWAAVISVVNGSNEALDWLTTHNYPHFVYLAEVLVQLKERLEESDDTIDL